MVDFVTNKSVEVTNLLTSIFATYADWRTSSVVIDPVTAYTDPAIGDTLCEDKDDLDLHCVCDVTDIDSMSILGVIYDIETDQTSPDPVVIAHYAVHCGVHFAGLGLSAVPNAAQKKELGQALRAVNIDMVE